MKIHAIEVVDVIKKYLSDQHIKHQVMEQFSVIFPLLIHVDDRTLHADCIYQVGVNRDMEAEFLYADTLLAITVPDENLVQYALTLCNAVNLEAVSGGGFIVFNYEADNRFMHRNGIFLPNRQLTDVLLDKVFGYTQMMIHSFIKTLSAALPNWNLTNFFNELQMSFFSI